VCSTTRRKTVAQLAAAVNGGWPLDEEGNPMDLITYGCEEKIGLPNYSNVTVGPASITRFAKRGDKAAIKSLTDDVEAILREQREIILRIVKRQAGA